LQVVAAADGAASCAAGAFGSELRPFGLDLGARERSGWGRGEHCGAGCSDIAWKQGMMLTKVQENEIG